MLETEILFSLKSITSRVLELIFSLPCLEWIKLANNIKVNILQIIIGQVHVSWENPDEKLKAYNSIETFHTPAMQIKSKIKSPSITCEV